MNKYELVLQIFAIFFLLFILYLLFRFVVASIRAKRLTDFSLRGSKESSEKSIIFRIIYSFSDFLKSLVIFNQYGKTYDKYIYEESRLRKGIDYISIKILLGISFVFSYLFISFLYRDPISSLLILLVFVIGFLLPDFYCLFIRRKKVKILNKNMLSAIIIMNNSFKANSSTEKAINDVISRTDGLLSIEFKKVLNDLKIGMNVSEAFLRMYRRVRISSILYISRVLSLVNKSGISIVEAFDLIESKLINEEKFNNQINVLNSTNKISLLIFSILPVIFILCIIFYNKEYIMLFTTYLGTFVLAIILILYVFYLMLLRMIFRGGKYDR